MKKHLLKALLVTGLVTVGGLGVTALNVNAQSVYDQVTSDQLSLVTLSEDGYTLEEMLTYAIQDEYLAQAEYQTIIDTFGAVKPFANIVYKEQTHIDLLVALFETYGFAIPENTAQDNVIVPDSLSGALATGIEIETENIAMYETFLAQVDLPNDVAQVFTSLMEASEHHLSAFSKDRLNCLGTDMANQIRNRFKKGGTQENGGTKNQYKGSNGNGGNKNQYNGTNGNDGICPNN